MQHPNSHNTVGDCTVAGSIVQVGSVGQLTVQHGPLQDGPSPAAGDDDWVARARGSSIWDHVPHNRDTDRYRDQVALVASRLAVLRDEAERQLADDPWQDPGFAVRFAERVEWLLGEPGHNADLCLYPAEAALLALAPFLYRVHALRIAVQHLGLEPWKLAPATNGGAERDSFEAFAEGNGLLVQRALLRPEAEAPIGWWLFHRWLVQHGDYGDCSETGSVTRMLEAVGEPAAALGDALAPLRVSRLLHGLRRGPDVCNPEYLDSLPADDRLRGPGHQRVRDQRLALLSALAYAVSVEMTALPDIVAEHLGIPHPVDLSQLRHTLRESGWSGPPDLPVLLADCAHEAVIEGLRAYTTRADELLHAVSRTARERINHPMPVLPSRLSADGVRPTDGAFTGWASFRLDERRIRGLLMGVQLYKDRDLAVRELYQNALDACRYRRARTEYLDRTDGAASYAYEGRIRFVQDTDEDGREYLECRDNGIGMGEAELRGVFSNAGARFAEQPDFREERAAWSRLDPPVPFFPNSRFGIGVLSYFMLADEIRVTTCRMGPTGAPGPLLEASVFGPGHLFRIVPVSERGEEPGTVVRIYLRSRGEDRVPDLAGWSCPDVLGRLLGIAEFPTRALHGAHAVEWAPGELRGRERPDGELFGLDADGSRLPWPDAPAGAQVIWCEHGGGLLVDGLVVQPAVRGGVLSSHPSGLTGAVVNLSGAFAPERLAADRSQILDDLRDTVRGLLAGAVGHLVAHGGPLLSFEWLCGVANGSMPAADLIAAECIANGSRLRHGKRSFDTAETGCLPADLSLVRPELNRFSLDERNPLLEDISFRVPDHIFLWRLLAHAPRMLSELAAVCPELDGVGPVLPALPSDHHLLSLGLGVRDYDPVDEPQRLTAAAAALAATPRDVALRAARLRLHGMPPDAFPDVPVRPETVAGVARAVRREVAARTRSVSVSSLVREAVEAGATVTEVAARWRETGTEVPDQVYRSALAAEEDDLLLPHLGEHRAPWFVPGTAVHPGLLAYTALELGVEVPDLCSRLVKCGLEADWAGLPAEPSEETVRLLSELLIGHPPWLAQSEPVPPQHVLLAAEEWQLSPAEAMERFARLGFGPPDPFPEVVEPDDVHLLTDHSDNFGDLESPLRPGRPVSYNHLLAASDELDIPLWDVAARLRAYGVRIPLRRPGPRHARRPVTPPIPGSVRWLDEELFQEEGPLPWYGVTTADVVPFAHVVSAARTLGMSPKDIAARLTNHGIELSCPVLPEGLSYSNALQLLTADEDMLLTITDHVDFQTLLSRARLMHEPIERVRGWLTELGIPVADPRKAVRAALPRVPLRDAGDGPPEAG